MLTSTTTPHTATPDVFARPHEGGVDVRALRLRARERWGVPSEADGPPLVGGCRVVQKPVAISPQYSNPAPDDARLDAVRELLSTWPVAAVGIGTLVDVFWPIAHEPPQVPVARGSTSGHEITPEGQLAAYVTIDDPYGCCEGLWHEFGHLRLRAMGIDMETHDGQILAHGDAERFISPVRKDVLRPMSAVLHGFYAWLMLTEGDLWLWRAGHADAVRSVLLTNLPKLEEGRITLRQHLRVTEEGRRFVWALMEWADWVIADGWWLVGEASRAAAFDANKAWIRTQAVQTSPLHDGVA